MNPIDQNRNF